LASDGSPVATWAGAADETTLVGTLKYVEVKLCTRSPALASMILAVNVIEDNARVD